MKKFIMIILSMMILIVACVDDDNGTNPVVNPPEEPPVIVVDYDFTITDGVNTWAIETIEPEIAYNLGAQYKYYTKVYLNDVEYGLWYTRMYLTTYVYLLNGDFFVNTYYAGGIKHINGDKTKIIVVTTDFVIHDYSLEDLYVYVNDELHYVTNNFIFNDYTWHENAGIWYSGSGYQWDGETLCYKTECD